MLPKTNTVALPGHILSQFRLKDFRAAECHFAQAFLETVAKAAGRQPPAVAERMLSAANETVAEGRFSLHSRAFDSEAQRLTHLPFLLWLSLSIRETITADEAEALITDENQHAVLRAVLEMMKYEFKAPAKNAGAAGEAPPPDPSRGTSSSGDSAPAGSPTETSNP